MRRLKIWNKRCSGIGWFLPWCFSNSLWSFSNSPWCFSFSPCALPHAALCFVFSRGFSCDRHSVFSIRIMLFEFIRVFSGFTRVISRFAIVFFIFAVLFWNLAWGMLHSALYFHIHQGVCGFRLVFFIITMVFGEFAGCIWFWPRSFSSRLQLLRSKDHHFFSEAEFVFRTSEIRFSLAEKTAGRRPSGLHHTQPINLRR